MKDIWIKNNLLTIMWPNGSIRFPVVDDILVFGDIPHEQLSFAVATGHNRTAFHFNQVQAVHFTLNYANSTQWGFLKPIGAVKLFKFHILTDSSSEQV